MRWRLSFCCFIKNSVFYYVSWSENKSTFCPEGRHYRYLSRLFVLQASLKNSSKHGVSYSQVQEQKRPMRNHFPTFYCVRLFLPAICLLNWSMWMNESAVTFIVDCIPLYLYATICLFIHLPVDFYVVLVLDMIFFR